VCGARKLNPFFCDPLTPDYENLTWVTMKNGACAALFGSVEYLVNVFKNMPRLKKPRIDAILNATQYFWKACDEDRPYTLYGQMSVKAEVAKHRTLKIINGVSQYVLKKVRCITNSHPVKYLMSLLLFNGQDALLSGIHQRNLAGVAIKDSHLDQMYRTWYKRCKKVLWSRGITSYRRFVRFMHKCGLDATDKKSWEATTKASSAIWEQIKLAMHIPPAEFERLRRQYAACAAEFTNPYICLDCGTDYLRGVMRPGCTESGHRFTLLSNIGRHLLMHDTFAVQMVNWFYYRIKDAATGLWEYKREAPFPEYYDFAKPAPDGIGPPPPVEEWHIPHPDGDIDCSIHREPGQYYAGPHIWDFMGGWKEYTRYESIDDNDFEIEPNAYLPLDEEFWTHLAMHCVNVMGDDSLCAATPLTIYKKSYGDWMFGTITTGGIEPFEAEITEDGRVLRGANYCQHHNKTDWGKGGHNDVFVNAVRCTVRGGAKLLLAPHSIPNALAASRAAMYTSGNDYMYQVAYDFYMDLLTLVAEDATGATLAKASIWTKHDHEDVPSMTSLIPPTRGDVLTFQAVSAGKSMRVRLDWPSVEEYNFNSNRAGG